MMRPRTDIATAPQAQAAVTSTIRCSDLLIGPRLAWAGYPRKGPLVFARRSRKSARGQREELTLQPDYPLETARLRLRPFTRGDVDAVYDYRRREDVALYLFDVPLSREECALAVQQRIGQIALVEEEDKIVLGVELMDDGTLIGEVSLILRNLAARQAEIGWIFHPDYQGRGYATEAAIALLDLAFRDGGMHRVMARCDARNVASAKLMERLGMRREAHFREHALFKGEWDEEFIYAILEREWPEKRRAHLPF